MDRPQQEDEKTNKIEKSRQEFRAARDIGHGLRLHGMNKKESSSQRGIDVPFVSTAFNVAKYAFGNEKNEQPIQEVEQKVDQVIAPDILSGPEIVERECQIENRSRGQQIPIRLAQADSRISVNGEQIVKTQRSAKRVPVHDQRHNEKRAHRNPEPGPTAV